MMPPAGEKIRENACPNMILHINAQLRTQDAQAQTVEKGERDSNDSQKSALGPRKANAMTASSVSSS